MGTWRRHALEGLRPISELYVQTRSIGGAKRDAFYRFLRAHHYGAAGVEACVLVPGFIREWFRCHVLRPLLRALRGGFTPRRLAWSLALGMVVGINPSVGLTTLFVVLVAWAFGLSKLASMVGTHVVAPLHLLLFIPFIEIGVHLFHTRRLPMNRKQLEHLSHHPLRLFHEIWQWEWHALIVWGVVAGITMPLLAVYLRRALVLLLRRHRTLVRSRPAVH